jgi:hypothetical protein
LASQEVYFCSEKRFRGDLLASCTKLGDVKVPYLVAGLSRGCSAGSLERLFASVAAFPRLALLLFPVFLEARPWLVGVLFPRALLLSTRARA